MLCEPLREVLRSGRSEFNAQFAHARRLYPELDGDAFARFVERTLDPWVRATHAVRPDRVADVAMAGYEVGLELVGQRIAGPSARHAVVEHGLVHVLPRAAAIAAEDPALAIAALSNALHELAITAGARPGEWIAALDRAVPSAGDLQTLLAVGQVAAWRAGLAHYRKSALRVAAGLPEALALSALGAAAGPGFAELHAALERDPWFSPDGDASVPRVAGVCGGFRGFGGPFVEPPRLARADGELLVKSGDDAWLLSADAFGATLHRATPEELALASEPKPERDALGLIEQLTLPAAGAVTSAIRNGTTLAVTSAWSHAVVLIAVGADA